MPIAHLICFSWTLLLEKRYNGTRNGDLTKGNILYSELVSEIWGIRWSAQENLLLLGGVAGKALKSS